MAHKCTSTLYIFCILYKEKSVYQRESLEHVSAFVIQYIQLALFYIVSENKSFLFQNVTAKASNQYFHISTSESCINVHDVQVHTFSTVCKEEKIQKCTP